MSATEAVQLYNALPAQEQRVVTEYIGKDAGDPAPEPKSQEEFKELVNQVFDKHNGLMERLAQ